MLAAVSLQAAITAPKKIEALEALKKDIKEKVTIFINGLVKARSQDEHIRTRKSLLGFIGEQQEKKIVSAPVATALTQEILTMEPNNLRAVPVVHLFSAGVRGTTSCPHWLWASEKNIAFASGRLLGMLAAGQPATEVQQETSHWLDIPLLHAGLDHNSHDQTSKTSQNKEQQTIPKAIRLTRGVSTPARRVSASQSEMGLVDSSKGTKDKPAIHLPSVEQFVNLMTASSLAVANSSSTPGDKIVTRKSIDDFRSMLFSRFKTLPVPNQLRIATFFQPNKEVELPALAAMLKHCGLLEVARDFVYSCEHGPEWDKEAVARLGLPWQKTLNLRMSLRKRRDEMRMHEDNESSSASSVQTPSTKGDQDKVGDKKKKKPKGRRARFVQRVNDGLPSKQTLDTVKENMIARAMLLLQFAPCLEPLEDNSAPPAPSLSIQRQRSDSTHDRAPTRVNSFGSISRRERQRKRERKRLGGLIQAMRSQEDLADLDDASAGTEDFSNAHDAETVASWCMSFLYSTLAAVPAQILDLARQRAAVAKNRVWAFGHLRHLLGAIGGTQTGSGVLEELLAPLRSCLNGESFQQFATAPKSDASRGGEDSDDDKDKEKDAAESEAEMRQIPFSAASALVCHPLKGLRGVPKDLQRAVRHAAFQFLDETKRCLTKAMQSGDCVATHVLLWTFALDFKREDEPWLADSGLLRLLRRFAGSGELRAGKAMDSHAAVLLPIANMRELLTTGVLTKREVVQTMRNAVQALGLFGATDSAGEFAASVSIAEVISSYTLFVQLFASAPSLEKQQQKELVELAGLAGEVPTAKTAAGSYFARRQIRQGARLLLQHVASCMLHPTARWNGELQRLRKTTIRLLGEEVTTVFGNVPTVPGEGLTSDDPDAERDDDDPRANGSGIVLQTSLLAVVDHVVSFASILNSSADNDTAGTKTKLKRSAVLQERSFYEPLEAEAAAFDALVFLLDAASDGFTTWFQTKPSWQLLRALMSIQKHCASPRTLRVALRLLRTLLLQFAPSDLVFLNVDGDSITEVCKALVCPLLMSAGQGMVDIGEEHKPDDQAKHHQDQYVLTSGAQGLGHGELSTAGSRYALSPRDIFYGMPNSKQSNTHVYWG